MEYIIYCFSRYRLLLSSDDHDGDINGMLLPHLRYIIRIQPIAMSTGVGKGSI
jgi:hypothetical protein